MIKKRFRKGECLDAVEQLDQCCKFYRKIIKNIKMTSFRSVSDKNLSDYESVSTSSENSDMSISFDLGTTCIPNKPLLQQNRVSCERSEVYDRAGVASCISCSFSYIEIFWNCYGREQTLCSEQK